VTERSINMALLAEGEACVTVRSINMAPPGGGRGMCDGAIAKSEHLHRT